MAEPTFFADELAQVEQLLAESLERLQSPLRELVAGQIAAARPYLRAAVVLVAATGESATADDERQRYLAAALEMLFVALNTHKELLAVETPERTLLGGTILVGDYCFGRAAELAVQTQHPQVVTIFSEALKTLSEGNLRQTLNRASEPITDFDGGAHERFDENDVLFQAGIRAASILANHPPAVQQALLALGRALAARLRDNKAEAEPLNVAHLPAYQRAAWEAVAARIEQARE